MKKSMLRKVLLLACSAVLLVCLSVGATVAYLTSAKTVTNTFTVGKVEIKLDEALATEDGYLGVYGEDGKIYRAEEGETSPRVKANDYKLLPGLNYAKDPTVTVLQGSEPAYVKLVVTVTKANETDQLFKDKDYSLENVIQGYDKNQWALLSNTKDAETNTRTYEFGYYGNSGAVDLIPVNALSADQKLPALFTAIQMPDDLTNDDLAAITGMEITVNAYAIQAAGFADFDAAFAAFPTK